MQSEGEDLHAHSGVHLTASHVNYVTWTQQERNERDKLITTLKIYDLSYSSTNL